MRCEQSRTLQALRESEERYALSARGANDGLWVWDLPRERGLLLAALEVDARLRGRRDRQRSRTSGSRACTPTTPRSCGSTLDLHLRGHTPHFENEHRMHAATASVRWMLSRGLAVRDCIGKATAHRRLADRHHRAQARRGAADVRRLPRRADAAAEPRAVHGPPQARHRRAARAIRNPSSRCSSSTSTASRS